MPRISLYRDRQFVAEHHILHDMVRFGRHPDNDIVLDDATLSWFHVRIEPRGSGFVVVNIAANIDITVNEQPLAEELSIQIDDVIAFGRFAVVFEPTGRVVVTPPPPVLIPPPLPITNPVTNPIAAPATNPAANPAANLVATPIPIPTGNTSASSADVGSPLVPTPPPAQHPSVDEQIGISFMETQALPPSPRSKNNDPYVDPFAEPATAMEYAPARAVLVLWNQGVEQGRFEVGDREMIIGRSKTSDVAIALLGLSRRHSRILPRADGYYLEDLGSQNGTWVNAQRIEGAYRLKNNDVINYYDYSLTFLEEKTGKAIPTSAPAQPAVEDEPAARETGRSKMAVALGVNARARAVSLPDDSLIGISPEPSSTGKFAAVGMGSVVGANNALGLGSIASTTSNAPTLDGADKRQSTRLFVPSAAARVEAIASLFADEPSQPIKAAPPKSPNPRVAGSPFATVPSVAVNTPPVVAPPVIAPASTPNVSVPVNPFLQDPPAGVVLAVSEVDQAPVGFSGDPAFDDPDDDDFASSFGARLANPFGSTFGSQSGDRSGNQSGNQFSDQFSDQFDDDKNGVSQKLVEQNHAVSGFASRFADPDKSEIDGHVDISGFSEQESNPVDALDSDVTGPSTPVMGKINAGAGGGAAVIKTATGPAFLRDVVDPTYGPMNPPKSSSSMGVGQGLAQGLANAQSSQSVSNSSLQNGQNGQGGQNGSLNPTGNPVGNLDNRPEVTRVAYDDDAVPMVSLQTLQPVPLWPDDDTWQRTLGSIDDGRLGYLEVSLDGVPYTQMTFSQPVLRLGTDARCELAMPSSSRLLPWHVTLFQVGSSVVCMRALATAHMQWRGKDCLSVVLRSGDRVALGRVQVIYRRR